MNRVVAHRLSRSQLTTKLRHNTLRWRSFSTSFSSKVNNFYQTGGPRKLPEPVSVASGSDVTDAQSILARDSAREWSEKDIKQAMKSHTLFTWGSSSSYLDNSIHVKEARGCYFWDLDGKKYLDFNSMAMCSLLGHHNEVVEKAVAEQMQQVSYVYPCQFTSLIKAKLSALLADLCPGDLNTFYYTGGGAESNESAIRIARRVTGRHKVLSRYRSYHGGTLGAISLTGDPRRWPSEPAPPGFIHFMDPFPYNFDWGATSQEELTARNLQYIQELIEYEGPSSVAAIVIEATVGTNGVLRPPTGYLEGLRAICDHYGILLVCDEVMAGFGRTGKLFSWMHSSPMIIPDMVTMAKGINGAFLPLGCVAVRDHIRDFYQHHPIMIGSTYNSHPVVLASAYAAIKWCLANGIYERAALLEPIMKEGMEMLANNHPCVKQARVHGLFGIFELQRNKQGQWLVPFNGTAPPQMGEFRNALLDNGLFTLQRWSQVYCNPPLIITADEIREAFQIFDRCLPILDVLVED